MKRIIAVLLVLLAFAAPVFAHSGRTDSNGGHYDNSSGEYHYHHGYPAHQHTNGKCPYNFKNKITYNNGSKNVTTEKKTEKKFDLPVFETLGWIILYVISWMILLYVHSEGDTISMILQVFLTVVFHIGFFIGKPHARIPAVLVDSVALFCIIKFHCRKHGDSSDSQDPPSKK